MWWTIGLGIIVFYLIYQQNENIKNLLRGRGYGHSTSFTINALDAVMKHPQFSKLSGIASASKTHDVREWSKEDKKKWQDLSKELFPLVSVHVNYFVSEDNFFIKYGSQMYFMSRSSSTNGLYNEIVLGDKDGIDPRLEFCIYERIIKKGKMQYERVISPCLKYHPQAIGKAEFTPLFDFPYQKTDGTDESMKSMGFEVEKMGGDYVFENDFGEMEGIGTIYKFKKNGAEISFYDK